MMLTATGRTRSPTWRPKQGSPVTSAALRQKRSKTSAGTRASGSPTSSGSIPQDSSRDRQSSPSAVSP